MNIEIDTKLFIRLLVAAFNNNVKIENIENIDWEQVYNISKKNSVSNIICYAIDKLGFEVPQEAYKKFKTDQLISVRHDAIQECEIKSLLDEYEENGIKCIVLKGTILKDIFPSSDMRVMGDVDLLLKKEQIPLAHAILLKNGYTEIVEENQNKETNPHEEYKKAPIMLVELHKFLFPQKGFEDIFEHYNHIWNNVVSYENYKNIYQMNDNEFYIYMILHIMKHYKRGGTGVRSLLDVWVYIKEKELNWDYIDSVFKRLGFSKFEKSIKELASIWFDGKENNNVLYKDMTEFILGSGTYGTEKNFKVAGIVKEEEGKTAGVKHILNIVFLPFDSMCMLYPALKKAPFLLLVYWIIRIFDRLINKKSKLKNEIAISSDVQYAQKLKNHFKNIGL